MNLQDQRELERQRLTWSLIYRRRISTLKGNTMSIEQALAELTAAVNANTAALLGSAATAKAAKPAEKAQAATTATSAGVATGAVAAVETAATVAFDDVKKAFLALVAKNREAATGILAKFGVGKLSEAKPEQHGPILEEINKAATAAPSLV